MFTRQPLLGVGGPKPTPDLQLSAVRSTRRYQARQFLIHLSSHKYASVKLSQSYSIIRQYRAKGVLMEKKVQSKKGRLSTVTVKYYTRN